MCDNPYVETEEEKWPSHLDNLVTREEWGATNPSREFEPFKRGLLTRIQFVKSLNTDYCTKKEECIPIVRKMQERHIAKGHDDIIYNFVIGGDLNIYVGRGWSALPPAPPYLKILEGTYLSVALIGDHQETLPSDPIFETMWQLVCYGTKKKIIHEDVELIPE